MAKINKIAITGASGRMGQLLIHEISQSLQCELSAALARPGNPLIGQDVGNLVDLPPFGLELSDDISHALRISDVVIDFSRPEATLKLIKENSRTPLMIGTSGFTKEQQQQIIQAARSFPIVLTSNTSLGVAIMKKVSKEIAKALGADYDIDIFEMHHRNKVDAPSGTALSLGQSLAQVPGFHLNDHAARSGPREKGAVEFAVARGGGVPGDHSVIYAGEKEILTLSHRALDRSLFAQGALRAALWVQDKEPGLYSMEDVIGS